MQIVRWKGPDLFDMSWLLGDEVSDDVAELGSADDPPCLMIPAKGGVVMAIFVQTVQSPPFSCTNFLHIFQTMDRVPDAYGAWAGPEHPRPEGMASRPSP